MYMPMSRVSGHPAAPAWVIGLGKLGVGLPEFIPGLGLLDAVGREDLLVVPDSLDVVLIRQGDHAAVDVLHCGGGRGQELIGGTKLLQRFLVVQHQVPLAEISVRADHGGARDEVCRKGALAGKERDLLHDVGLRDLLVFNRECRVLCRAGTLGQRIKGGRKGFVLVRRQNGEAAGVGAGAPGRAAGILW